MTDNNDYFACYTSEEISPPTSDYWAERRRTRQLIKQLQLHLQTIAVPLNELEQLNNELEQQIQALSDTPELPGRKAWVDTKEFGSFGCMQTEVTPIMGPSSPLSPDLSIWFEQDKALATVTFDWMYEGNYDMVHGGWVAAVFDELLGTAQVLSGSVGMTGSLTTRYHKPTPLNQQLRLEAKVKHISGRKITMIGEMWADETMTASCEGLFISVAALDQFTG